MPGASFPKSEAEGWTPFRELTNEQRRRLEHRPGAVLRALNEPTELSPSDIEVLSKAKLVQYV